MAEADATTSASDVTPVVKNQVNCNSDQYYLKEKEQCPERIPYNEIYHVGLISQPNIYSACKIDTIGNSKERLLIGSLSGKVSCVECSSSTITATHKVQSDEVYFSYIPVGAEIVSIDAFVKRSNSDDIASNHLIVGISLVLLKGNQQTPYSYGSSQEKHFLNVYASIKQESEPKLDEVADSCQHIELGFTPYQLTHARVKKNGVDDVVFLLSGSDKKVHMFSEDYISTKFVEQDINPYFPEFSNLPSNVTWIDIHLCRDEIRATAMACESGYIRFCTVDENTSEILHSYSFDVDGPSLSIKVFPLEDTCTSSQDLEHLNIGVMKMWQEEPTRCDSATLNLLVTSALDTSVVFRSPQQFGFSDMIVLHQSDHHDSVTCSLITDIDCDGNNEVIIGTYGQEILIYNWRHNNQLDRIHFDLVWHCSFTQPIFALNQLDLVGDGMKELAVATLTSVHILQRDVSSSVTMLVDKLIELTSKSDQGSGNQQANLIPDDDSNACPLTDDNPIFDEAESQF